MSARKASSSSVSEKSTFASRSLYVLRLDDAVRPGPERTGTVSGSAGALNTILATAGSGAIVRAGGILTLDSSGANNAAGYQLATGDAVMAIGGFIAITIVINESTGDRKSTRLNSSH